MSTSEPSGASSVAIDLALGEILRDQTLLILEINAGSFEEARELPPGELLALASTFRDAFVVLDTIGWLPEQLTGSRPSTGCPDGVRAGRCPS
jgi:hypothetical protein